MINGSRWHKALANRVVEDAIRHATAKQLSGCDGLQRDSFRWMKTVDQG
jgi:hypothetical protein